MNETVKVVKVAKVVKVKVFQVFQNIPGSQLLSRFGRTTTVTWVSTTWSPSSGGGGPLYGGVTQLQA